MTKLELRISPDLLAEAMESARSKAQAVVAIEVDRYAAATQVEFIARRLATPGVIAHSSCIALAVADSAIDAFVRRVSPLTRAGFAGCLLFGANGPLEAGIGFVCIGQGVDWLQELVVVRQTAPESVTRWPLNRHMHNQFAGAGSNSRTEPNRAVQAPRHLAVLGTGPMAVTLAKALFSAGLADQMDSFPADQAHAALARCDVLVACLATDEPAFSASLQAMCEQRLRLLVEVRAVHLGCEEMKA